MKVHFLTPLSTVTLLLSRIVFAGCDDKFFEMYAE